ncbi:hypothetical protein TCAL_11331 [Tigriopus californicus]|uniref:MARVEL domain-containing protein n=1 Tax=Tigriopus californicus TaxID=6832 RepID=A0A553N7I3_TIGCA|nr:hypothetical protein TCAL_11331 [Tigriopus californicus]|eukprot:TCALIF_11331-PA protein Name:"Protein of unknown function" AED:0.06 eAED:0.10 QI:94/0.75/0.6/1/0/0.4/5/55/732
MESGGNGSLGRYSVGTDISGGSAATRHWVNSVSDIYGPDEIEELLEDLNRLELAAFETEDIQDFDIDGSQVGSVTAQNKRGRRKYPRPRSNRGNIADEISGPGSPTFSVNSWDSHAVYQHYHEPRDGDEDDAGGGGGGGGHGVEEGMGNGQGLFIMRRMHSILCFCDISTFKNPRTLIRVLFVLTCTACLLCLFTAPTAPGSWDNLEYYVPNLSHLPKLRFLMFICIFSILFTMFVLFLNISHVNALIPLDLGFLQSVVYASLTLAFIVSSALVLHVHTSRQSTIWSLEPFWTRSHLLIASILGFICSLEAFLCIFNCHLKRKAYEKVLLQESSTHFTLHETATNKGGCPPIQSGPSAPPVNSRSHSTNEAAPITAQTPEGQKSISHPFTHHNPSQSLAMKQSKPAPLLNPAEQYLVNENYRQETAAPLGSGPQTRHLSDQSTKSKSFDPERTESDNRHRSKTSSDIAQSNASQVPSNVSQKPVRHGTKAEGLSSSSSSSYSQTPKLPPPSSSTANPSGSLVKSAGAPLLAKSKQSSQMQSTSFTTRVSQPSTSGDPQNMPKPKDSLGNVSSPLDDTPTQTVIKALVQPEPFSGKQNDFSTKHPPENVEHVKKNNANGVPSRDTGAIPKKKATAQNPIGPSSHSSSSAAVMVSKQPHQPSTSSSKKTSTNHLDEIITIPMDDDMLPDSATKMPSTSSSSKPPHHRGLNGDSVNGRTGSETDPAGSRNVKKLK